jgi:hypothetical protein
MKPTILTGRGLKFCLVVAVTACARPVGQAITFDNRFWSFGEDPDNFEGNTLGAVIGSLNTGAANPNSAVDAAGPNGNYFDIAVFGNPVYAAVDRPNALGTTAAKFDGDGDYLSHAFSINLPTESWSINGAGVNQTGIASHGMQMWVKPDSTKQNVLQDIITDTPEHGIYITADNDWGYFYDDVRRDTNVDVAFDTWSHVMTLAGFQDRVGGHRNGDGVMLVNGVAVGAYFGAAEHDLTPITIGASQDGTTNFYKGLIDNIHMFIWGNNSSFAPPYGGGSAGRDFGTLFLGTDNEWIAAELAALGATDPGDANLDGSVNDSDVALLVNNWGTRRLVGGVQVGDWLSRQDGDLNYDGIVDLDDAYLLNQRLIANGAGALDFSIFGAQVPEPGTWLVLALGGAAVAARRRVSLN